MYRWQDTCNAYLIVSGEFAVALDFGSGEMLEHLAEIGVKRIEYILHTHHHRDQCQGDYLALETGTEVLVPEAEQDLFAHVDQLWQGREIQNNYKVRQDRFSLLSPIDIAGVLCDMSTWSWRGYDFFVLPTPGHSTGSISLIVDIDEEKVAFTGDLIYSGGKLWSLAATQWMYNSHQGVLATLYSIDSLEARNCTRFLPSHGPVIDNPAADLEELRQKITCLNRVRDQGLDWEEQIARPWKNVTPNLLYNTLSGAVSWLLLGSDGKALIIDSGYYFNEIQVVSGFDRASRRVLPPPMKQLREEFGINEIEVAIATHYHDDHVCSMPILKRMFNTQTWIPESFADILREPKNYDLPCLWFDPLPVDRRLQLNQTVRWQDYELTILPLPGHTHYAAAISFEVDGKKVIAVGDQHYDDPYLWNYVYQNRFALGDYPAAFALYRKFQPDIILSGHFPPFDCTPELLEGWTQNARALDEAHRKLLPLEEFDWDAGGTAAFIEPYQAAATSGQWLKIAAHVKNPLDQSAQVLAELVVPENWSIKPIRITETVPAGKWTEMLFEVRPISAVPRRRIPIAIDITIADARFGQVAECLFDVIV